jgi:hypothetical protein
MPEPGKVCKEKNPSKKKIKKKHNIRGNAVTVGRNPLPRKALRAIPEKKSGGNVTRTLGLVIDIIDFFGGGPAGAY